MEKIRSFLAVPIMYIAIKICKLADWIAGDGEYANE